jgi:hypothetical protein
LANSTATNSEHFAKGQIFRKCVTERAETTCPEKFLQKFKNTSFSGNTVAGDVKERGNDVQDQLRSGRIILRPIR